MAAIGRMPSQTRAAAAEIAYLSAAGWGTVEIGSRIGRSWREVNAVRDRIGDAVVGELIAEGYSKVDAIRALRVPSARVLAAAERNGSGDGRA